MNLLIAFFLLAPALSFAEPLSYPIDGLFQFDGCISSQENENKNPAEREPIYKAELKHYSDEARAVVVFTLVDANGVPSAEETLLKSFGSDSRFHRYYSFVEGFYSYEVSEVRKDYIGGCDSPSGPPGIPESNPCIEVRRNQHSFALNKAGNKFLTFRRTSISSWPGQKRTSSHYDCRYKRVTAI